ncbi:hypothetical protein GCM10007937_55390 [Mesorhizobium albiziae]|nr:hypothetical protein GCM10007937_55390 [Mesorhizobium albiziae]
MLDFIEAVTRVSEVAGHRSRRLEREFAAFFQRAEPISRHVRLPDKPVPAHRKPKNCIVGKPTAVNGGCAGGDPGDLLGSTVF